MDGPNVNLAFKKHLQNHFLTQNTTFLGIATCPLHTIYNGSFKGVRVIDFDTEQFIIDISAFKLPSAPERIIRNSRKLLSCFYTFP